MASKQNEQQRKAREKITPNAARPEDKNVRKGAGPQGGPGESGPGERGYEGKVAVGEEGANED